MKERRSTSIDRLQQLRLGKTSKLKLLVWRTRRLLRDTIGKDALAVEEHTTVRGADIKRLYLKINDFMLRFFPRLESDTPKDVALEMLRDAISELGYTIVENPVKPWGATFRMDSREAERFVHEFFPGLTMKEAQMGNPDLELSPKFMLLSPGVRISWQYHHNRAEKWRFLTDGAYITSETDEIGKVITGRAGDIVQFDARIRHRGLANQDGRSYTLIAEIWQHTNPDELSTEDDIVRIQDDYRR